MEVWKDEHVTARVNEDRSRLSVEHNDDTGHGCVINLDILGMFSWEGREDMLRAMLMHYEPMTINRVVEYTMQHVWA